MIEFRNVSKSFWTGSQRKVILDRASFRVDVGTSLGILAPNGTGKTTLVNMMAGLEKPDEGEIIRDSKTSFPLGFMGGVVSRVSAVENSRFIARLYGLDPDYVESFCRWLCDLGEYFEQPLGTYSSGMRSRFSFALMLALDFDIYLVDEGMPSAGDAEFNKRAGDLLAERLRATSDDTVAMMLHDAGPLTAARLLTTGDVPDDVLATYAEGFMTRHPAPVSTNALLAAFHESAVSSQPYAYAKDISGERTLRYIEADPGGARQVLPDSAWVSLQAICGA